MPDPNQDPSQDPKQKPPLDREAKRRLAVIRHVEEVTGNVTMTCRYFICRIRAIDRCCGLPTARGDP